MRKIFSSKAREVAARTGFAFCATASALAVIAIVMYLLYASLPAFRQIGVFNFLFGSVWQPNSAVIADPSKKYGIFPMIIGSLCVTAIAVVLGGFSGVFTAVFASKFCPKKLRAPLKHVINLLAGIPSVVYGFFGIMCIVPLLANISPNGQGYGMLSGGVVLSIMIIPTVCGISKTTLDALPNSYYEGAIALGASKEQAVFHVLIPAARQGIITALILGFGRAVGETMAVMSVIGNSAALPDGLFSSIRTLTTNIVIEMGYATGLHRESLIATGFVLLCFLLILTLSVNILTRKKRVKKSEANAPLETATSDDILSFGNETSRLTASTSDSTRNSDISVECAPSNIAAIGDLPKAEFSRFLKVVSAAASAIVCAAALVIILFILIKGLPEMSVNLLFGESGNSGMTLAPAFLTTFYLIIISLSVALPLGIGAAIFLNEYARRGSKIVTVINTFTETLSGIPSIVFGLFGMVFFGNALKLGNSILNGALTLSIMILPTVIRSCQESLSSVPDSLREASLALGATKFRTVMRVVLPNALHGIITAVILSVGRVIGESAALIYTAGACAYMPNSPLDAGAGFAVMLWMFSSEGLYLGAAYATAAVLIILSALLNGLTAIIEYKVKK